MPRVEGKVVCYSAIAPGYALVNVGLGDGALLEDAQHVVIYPADEDPAGEAQRRLEETLRCTKRPGYVMGLQYDDTASTEYSWEAYQPDGEGRPRMFAYGPTPLAAAQALLAKLQPPEKRVGEMTETEKVSELLEAGWELGHWNTTIDPRIISLSITCRETGARITAFDETVSAILTKLLASAHKLREEASQ